METKYCSSCLQTLERSFFQKNKAANDGLQNYCKPCRKVRDARPEKRADDRARYHSNRDSYLDSYYKRVYGVSLEWYMRTLEEQSGVCAICKGTCPTGRRLCVDHNHTDGSARGLLCTRCNSALGQMQDSVEIAKECARYLTKHREHDNA